MCLKGKLGYKGERGFSAYEIAVQNGFEGSEQDWLATLGTSSHFQQNKITYTTESINENEFNLPSTYTNNSFVDVYIEGERLNSSEYIVNENDSKIVLTKALEVIGTKVEIVMITMSTNNLPIVTEINSSADNTTVPGTKAIYDFVKEEIDSTLVDYVLKGDFAIIKGTRPHEYLTYEVPYPEGFSLTNCVPISYVESVPDPYGIIQEDRYSLNSLEMAQGQSTPGLGSLLLTSSGIAISNSTHAIDGVDYKYKIVLMKVGEENE